MTTGTLTFGAYSTPVQSWGSMLTRLRTMFVGVERVEVSLKAKPHPRDPHAIEVKDSGDFLIGYVPRSYNGKEEMWDLLSHSKAVTHAMLMLADGTKEEGLQPELPLEGGQVTEQTTGQTTEQPVHLYDITQVTYLKPNPTKRPYSPEWRGYLMLSGAYTPPGGETVPFNDKPVSLVQREDDIIAREHVTYDSRYADQCDLLPVGGAKLFQQVATTVTTRKLLAHHELPKFDGLFYHVPMSSALRIKVIPKSVPDLPPMESEEQVEKEYQQWKEDTLGQRMLASGILRNEEESI